MTDFLFRMVQRAAGRPGTHAVPQPPRHFYWPSTAAASASQPEPRSLSPARSHGTARAPSFEPARTNPTAAKPGMPPITVPDLPQSERPFMNPMPTTNSGLTNEEIVESGQPMVPAEENIPSLRQTVSARETILPSRAIDRANVETVFAGNPAMHQVPPSAIDLAVLFDSAASPALADVPEPSAGTRYAHLQSIEDAISAMNEPRADTEPSSLQENIPPRLTPPMRNRATRSPGGSSVQAPPAVEVKIGSVEIVFDPPPAQPAPARPAGFAEFADLRRYASRPWTSSNQ